MTAKTEAEKEKHAITIIKAKPPAWATALALAGGQANRLDIQPDGSVIIRNKPVR
jgi:hypothetical protein